MSTAKPGALSVAVIGAGAAGLVTTRELLREGHQVTTFEQNDNVGGIWDYQEECETEDLLGRDTKRRHVHSSMYKSLRTNLPRQIMSFSDFPFIPEAMGPKSHDSRRFPSHTEVQAWLEVFASRFELRQHIQFNSQIMSLSPIPVANPSSNPVAQRTSAPVTAAPRWKLTVQRTPASKAYTQHGAQPKPHTRYASGTLHAKSQPPDLPDSASELLPAEVSTTEPALVFPPNGTAACHVANTANSDGAHAETNGGSQHHSAGSTTAPCSGGRSMRQSQSQTACAAFTDIPCLGGCSMPQSQSETPSDPQTQDVSQERLPKPVDANASEQSQHEFDAVVVCVGNYHQPNLPDVKGIDDFPGLQMHAHNYRNPAMFEGQVVIVVGASFSGEELARAVAAVGSHVYHSARSFEKSTPHGNITRVPMLTELAQDSTATFQDGTRIHNIDAVIYCTGYQYAYPFLEGTGLVTSHDMRVDPLWQHIFPPSVAPTLAFIGLAWKSIRNQQFELQAKLVARALSGRASLPSQDHMLHDIADFYQLLIDSGVPVRYTHNQTEVMPVNQWVYNAKLAQLCGPDVKVQPDWLRTLYSATTANILGSPDTFRDVWGPEEVAAFKLADQFCDQML